MSKDTIRKIYIITMAVYLFLAASFYFLVGDQLKYKESVNNTTMLEADSVTDELIQGFEVKQNFLSTIDRIETMSIAFTKFYKDGKGQVVIDILDKEELIYRQIYNIEDIPEQQNLVLNMYEPLEFKGKNLTLKIYSNAKKGEGVAVLMNKENAPQGSYVNVGPRHVSGTLCFSVTGSDIISVANYYWYGVIVIGLILALILFNSYRKFCNGRYDYIVGSILALNKYKFLISQLVSRDFKSKYKRSILGVFWSFLNPLLTMIVQFLVFSTFFKADTRNYPVYLLSGVVCFNFFKETTDMCLTSISGNTNLINKVYIPKYIFPLAKTISSTINLGMSLVPLLVVSVIMGIKLKISILLILYFLACLVVFSLGFGMLLATLMVFFRDIQFLWGVIVQIWQYATPIFYPAEIVPERYRFILRLNPLYHFIGNLRKCLIDGISPEPIAYLYCLVFAAGMFFIGSYVFKKSQDKFTLYL